MTTENTSEFISLVAVSVSFCLVRCDWPEFHPVTFCHSVLDKAASECHF